MDKETENIISQARSKRLEDKCDNLYDQITELRTTVQEIYGDLSVSERTIYQHILKLSERLEILALEFHKTSSQATNTTINVSPQINPEIDQKLLINNAIESKEEKENTPESKKGGILGINFDNLMTVSMYVVIGFVVLIGFLATLCFKLFDVFGGFFK